MPLPLHPSRAMTVEQEPMPPPYVEESVRSHPPSPRAEAGPVFPTADTGLCIIRQTVFKGLVELCKTPGAFRLCCDLYGINKDSFTPDAARELRKAVERSILYGEES